MKYDITYSCGHEGVVELFGKSSARESKLAWYQNTAVCPKCYAAEQAAAWEAEGYAKLTVPYREYKDKYEGRTDVRKGEYDKDAKTITLYVLRPVVTDDAHTHERITETQAIHALCKTGTSTAQAKALLGADRQEFATKAAAAWDTFDAASHDAFVRRMEIIRRYQAPDEAPWQSPQK
mgnify:CR=1 FL=1